VREQGKLTGMTPVNDLIKSSLTTHIITISSPLSTVKNNNMKYYKNDYLKLFIIWIASFYCCNVIASPNNTNGLNNWSINGYTSINLNVPDNTTAELEIDDLAMFVQGRINKYFNPFIEVEMARLQIWVEGDGFFPHSGEIDLERLYNEFHLTDKVHLRLGKMLAPVGEWNQIHAAPLVNTINRPLTTYINFSEFISGTEIKYLSNTWWPNISIYYQPSTEISPKSIDTRPVRYENVSGINLQYGDEFSAQLGLSIQHAKLVTRDESQTLYSIDGQNDFSWIQLSSQLSYATIRGTEITSQRNYEWGGYLQAVMPIQERWTLVVRQEAFLQRDQSQTHYNTIFDINLTPNDIIIWKIEYVFQKGAELNIHEGFYTSFGMMF